MPMEALLLAADAPASNPLMGMLIMLVPMFVIMYLLVWKPQRKKEHERQDMLKKTKAGDEIITIGGIYGTVMSVTDDSFWLKVDEKVKIRISRSSIAVNRSAEQQGASPQTEKKTE